MAEEVKNVADVQIEDTVKRINELNAAKAELEKLQGELETHKNDLHDTEVVYGADSKQVDVQKEHVTRVSSRIEDVEKKIAELTFKRSDLKPVLDELTKQFEVVIKEETSKEYHIELASDAAKAKKVFKRLLDYLNNNVKFTPATAVSLMVLVRNMEENKAWVNSKDFDGVIILRSASVLSLYKFILDELEGKGFYEARTFLECWANCGQSISDVVRLVKKDNAKSREIGANLNLVESEFNRSENDIPTDETQISTQEEVAPEIEA